MTSECKRFSGAFCDQHPRATTLVDIDASRPARPSPLLPLGRHPSAVFMSHHDERGAGFYAVGFARASGGGIGDARSGLGLCAVVTSSGTAVANLLPAAAEADASGLPMLLLTADRPPELRGCGSNQTIDQVRFRALVGSEVWRDILFWDVLARVF